MSENSPPSGEEKDIQQHVLPALAFSPGRVQVLAGNTFTQLVRMKTFHFLILFSVLIILVSTTDFLYEPIEKLLTIKRWSFGGMYVFGMVYALASTAILLPKDLEDRTLYTILSKPVPRFEYLLGRWLGVILVLLIALLVMFGVMAVLVWFHHGAYEAAMLSEFEASRAGEAVALADLQNLQATIDAQGVTGSLFAGLWGMFLKASVVAAVTLFISTIATSTLFTIICSTMLVFIGHFHKLAMDFWLNRGEAGAVAEILGNILVLIVPDFGMFDLTDEVTVGTAVSFGSMAEMTGLGVFYVAIYLLVAQLVFIDKEL